MASGPIARRLGRVLGLRGVLGSLLGSLVNVLRALQPLVFIYELLDLLLIAQGNGKGRTYRK